MRAIDLRLSLSHSNILVVRTEGVARAQNHLPPVFHTSCRRHDIIISIALVELGALDGGLVFVSVIYYARRSCDSGAVGRHRSHKEHRLHSCSRTGTAVGEISLAVLI